MKHSPNHQAINKLADEFAQRLPDLLAHRRRRFKGQVIKCMRNDAIDRMKKSELKDFLRIWRMILTEIEQERNWAGNKHAAGGDAGGLSASQEKGGAATASPHPMNSTR